MPIPGNVSVSMEFTPSQVAFIKQAAELVAPGMTNAELAEWVASEGRRLVSERIKELVVASLREQANAARREWAEQFNVTWE